MIHLPPPAKCADLLAIIDKGWEPNSFHTHQEITKLLVNTNTASIILLLGSYFFICFQQWLNAYLAEILREIHVSTTGADHTATA